PAAVGPVASVGVRASGGGKSSASPEAAAARFPFVFDLDFDLTLVETKPVLPALGPTMVPKREAGLAGSVVDFFTGCRAARSRAAGSESSSVLRMPRGGSGSCAAPWLAASANSTPTPSGAMKRAGARAPEPPPNTDNILAAAARRPFG